MGGFYQKVRTMKTKFLSLLVALFTTTAIFAYDFKYDGFFYKITSSVAPYTVELSDTIEDAFSHYHYTTVTIPSTVTYNGISYSVTRIREYAFGYCSELISITIPNSVTSIGDHAFYGSGISSITIPNSVASIEKSTFADCANLTSINMEGVRTIGNKAFAECTALTSVTIPNSVTSIGNIAFAGCTALTSVTIPNSVTSIGNRAFAECTALTSVTIPNSVTSMGKAGDDEDVYFWDSQYPFDGCISLSSIVVEEGNPNYDSRDNCNAIIETATNKLVQGCRNSTIPEGVTSIEDCAFCSCVGLHSITIPSSVTSIGNYAFSGCSSLSSIVVEKGNPKYDSRNNCNAIIETATNKLILGCKSTFIPEGVICIGSHAFDCSDLTSITIPKSLTSIVDDYGVSVFACCNNLSSIVVEDENPKYDSRNNCNAIIETATNTLVQGCKSTTIPNGVTSIGNKAFYECVGLTSLTIPNGVTDIGAGAFFYCSALISLTIPNSVKTIGDAAFQNVPNIIYSGSDSVYGEWYEKSRNGYVDGYFVYKDATRSTLLACSSAATGSITIPNSVTSIGDLAFADCTALTTITIPNSVKTIGNSAFAYVPNIVYNGTDSVDAPWGARSMNGYVDGYLVYKDATRSTLLACSSAATGSITIPHSVTTIGDMAFYKCSKIKSLTILTETPPVLEGDVFWHGYFVIDVHPDTPIYIPRGTKSAYQSAKGWCLFSNFIETETAIENTETEQVSHAYKILRNGQILIKNGDKTYTATGMEIK